MIKSCDTCECSIFSMDSNTPINVPLSAFYKRSFAFYTVKERMPVILTKLIDYLARDKNNIIEKFGEGAREDIKTVIGSISKLKYEIQTNKLIPELDSKAADAKIYNDYLNELAKNEGRVRFFTTIWLHAECFMYRKVKAIFENTEKLKTFDYFLQQKEESLDHALSAIIALSNHLVVVVKNPEYVDAKEEFINLMKLNLWGNRCDLSLTLSETIDVIGDPMANLSKFAPYILADDSEQIWEAISTLPSATHSRQIDFINDNAGYELFTDFCVADFLITFQLADKIVFHVKNMPWFISDATEYDCKKMIRILLGKDNVFLKKLVVRWSKFVREHVWIIKTNSFWTLPFPYCRMINENPALYNELSLSSLLIFKGDLNYRKLLGEINWTSTTPFSVALQGFLPTQLCAIRTVKADIICGLPKGCADALDNRMPDWMTTGNFGVIQFASPPDLE